MSSRGRTIHLPNLRPVRSSIGRSIWFDRFAQDVWQFQVDSTQDVALTGLCLACTREYLSETVPGIVFAEPVGVGAASQRLILADETIWIADAHRGDGGPNAMCRPKKPLRRGATSQSRDIIGVMTCPQMIHSCPAWVYKSKSNS